MKTLKNLLICKKINVLFIIILLSSFTNIKGQQLAFPTAMGAGAYASGGRGGIVVHVTNLNNSGTGSLRSALEDYQDQDRTIVFDVSGVIELTTDIVISSPSQGGNASGSITIAGQTAPQGNVTITGGKIRTFGVDNIIIRYVKFRSTTNVNGTLQLIDGNNIILDHLSGSHVESAEVTFSVTSNGEETTGKTIQNCLIYNSGLGCIIGDTTPSSPNYNPAEHSVLRNAYINTGHRIPFKAGGAVKVDAINNFCHNWNNRLIRMDDWDYTLNHIGNYYSGGYNSNQLKHCAYFGDNNGLIYNNDNYMDPDETTPDYLTDESVVWTEFQNNYNPMPSSSFVNTQFPLKGNINYTIFSSNQLKTEVLPYVGTYKYIDDNGLAIEDRDSFDAEAIQKGIDEPENDAMNTSLSISEIPTQNNTRPSNFYQSNPHIPEAYLTSRGITGNPTIHNDIQLSGYTLLEEYINQVDNTEPIPVIDVTGVEVTPETEEITIPETITLTATVAPSNATNQSGEWSSSAPAIATVDANGTVTPLAVGEVIITFTTNDGGFFDTSTITVFPEAFQANAGPDQFICLGESATLLASGGINYLWSNGETTASIEVNPTQTTTYTVTVSDDLGNSDTDDVVVTVNPLPTANAGEDVTICEGETVTLTATGGDTYLWNTGETTQSIDVSPNAETIYSVEVFLNACSSIDNVTVFVDDAPNITVSEDVNIIEGNSTILSVTGSDNYLWSTGETTPTITVSPTVTTTYSVTSVNTNGCSTTENIIVTVEELLVVSAGEDQFVCQNDDYEIVLTATAGDSYLWNTGDTTQSIVVSPLATSTYTVTVTLGSQQDSDDVTVFVSPNPNVVITNGDSVDIMSGDFVTLSATGANTYQWNNGATQPNIAVSPSQTTTYEVRGYINDCYDEKQVTVNVIPEVIADAGEDQEICIGETVTLTANGGDEYVWSSGETTQSIVVSPTETTTYTVTVFNALDFDEDSVVVFVDTDCEIDTNPGDPDNGLPLDFNFSVYPNPADNFVDLKLSGSIKLTRLYLYDITGKLIYEKRVLNESLNMSSITRIDVSSLRPGMYLIKLKDIDKELNRRLIIN